MTQEVDDLSENIVPLHQRKPLTSAERSRAYRQRKRSQSKRPTIVTSRITEGVTPTVTKPDAKPLFRDDACSTTEPITLPSGASIILVVAALGLGGVGVVVNGWFAQSLGSTEAAGWLFMAIGTAADLAALALPCCAARLWRDRRRGAATAGWAIWVLTFAFAITAGIGFASLNIADTTTGRAGRDTPAITTARTALADAKGARDRECARGIGPICRQREDIVVARQQQLDAAIRSIEATADPQTEAAARLVTWASIGALQPTRDDFSMVRLLLLALLPQMSGLLLMVARSR